MSYKVCTRATDGHHYHAVRDFPTETLARQDAEQRAAGAPGERFYVVQLIAAFVADQVREVPL